MGQRRCPEETLPKLLVASPYLRNNTDDTNDQIQKSSKEPEVLEVPPHGKDRTSDVAYSSDGLDGHEPQC